MIGYGHRLVADLLTHNATKYVLGIRVEKGCFLRPITRTLVTSCLSIPFVVSLKAASVFKVGM